jgi:hypothetical protein
MDDFLPVPPPVTDGAATGEHKLVPGEHTAEQATLEFGHDEV